MSKVRIAAAAFALVALGVSTSVLVISCAQGPIEPHVEKPPPPKARETSYGKATWYGGRFHGRKTASGERFDKNAFTCAHRTLPFGTIVRITNLENDYSVQVRVNDRGPYGKGRIVDVSEAAAHKLAMIHRGVVKVRLEVMSKPKRKR